MLRLPKSTTSNCWSPIILARTGVTIDRKAVTTIRMGDRKAGMTGVIVVRKRGASAMTSANASKMIVVKVTTHRNRRMPSAPE